MSNMEKKVCSYIIFFNISIIIFTFISCSGVESVKDSKYYTIKDYITELDESISWSSELEGNILGKTFQEVDGIDSKADHTPYSYLMKKTKKVKAVYPYVNDFTSLDISLYPESALTLIEGFCNGVLCEDNLEDFYDDSTMYDLALFLYDYEKLVSEGKKYCDFVIGKPFISDYEDIFECPIRFYEDLSSNIVSYSRESMDLCLYLIKKNGTYKIQEIKMMDKQM